MDEQSSGRQVTTIGLIGRATELGQLEAAWGEAQEGHGRCLLVSGEGGVGKSRLLAELGRRAGVGKGGQLVGRCFESDAGFPYAPIIDGLRAFLADKTAAETIDLLGPLAPELRKLLPELAISLPPPERPAAPSLTPEAEKRRLFEALAQLFTRRLVAHAKAPLLMMIEDIHWSDEVSLEFLHFFIRRLTAFPVLLLLSYRREERSPQLDAFLARLNRERLAGEVALGPLERDGTAALLRAALGQAVDASFVDAVYQLTEGNPFFIEEVLSALIAAGVLVYENGRWRRQPTTELHIPRSLLLAVEQRTRQLSGAARDLLALAAAAGRRFDFALLQRLTQHDETQLLSLIKELIAARLVIEETADIFAFRHALTREAVYAALLARERRALHRAIAETLEALRDGGEAAGRDLADLAVHYHAAGLWQKALTYGHRAGVAAQEQFAPQAALDHFRRAAAAAAQLGQPPPLELVQRRGKAHQLLGRFEAALADFEGVLARAKGSGDRRRQWRALRDLGFLWMARDYDKTGDYLERALDLARSLEDAELLAHSLNRLGNWLANVGQVTQALAYHEEALAIFEKRRDKRGTAVTLDLIATTLGIMGNAAQSAAFYRRALPLFRELDDRQGLASSLLMLAGYGHVSAGEEALQITRDIGWRDGEANAHMRLSIVYLMGGAPIWQQTVIGTLILVDVAAGEVDRAALLAEARAEEADVAIDRPGTGRRSQRSLPAGRSGPASDHYPHGRDRVQSPGLGSDHCRGGQAPFPTPD